MLLFLLEILSQNASPTLALHYRIIFLILINIILVGSILPHRIKIVLVLLPKLLLLPHLLLDLPQLLLLDDLCLVQLHLLVL